MTSSKFPVLIRACWFSLNHHFSRKISSLPITTVQYTVLRTLFDYNEQKINQGELSKLISSNKNNLSSIINRLKGLGYVELHKNKKDMREKNISLSVKGKEVFFECRKKAILIQDRMTKDFLPDDVTSLTKYLETVNQRIPLK